MAEGNKVTRIKASDNKPKKETGAKSPDPTSKKLTSKTSKIGQKKTAKKLKPAKKQTKLGKFFAPITGYFKGAWEELKQVRWPNRKSTWGLTLAVILFASFFLLIVVLLDTFFKYIFELIIT